MTSTASLKTGVIEGPRREDWEKIKKPFRQVYILDGLSLPDSMCEMERAYGFIATEGSFKKHIKMWGPSFWKNKREGADRPTKEQRKRRRRAQKKSLRRAEKLKSWLAPKTSRPWCPPSPPATYCILSSCCLLYTNKCFQHCEKAIYLQFSLLESARNDPSWMSLSKFDYPGAPRLCHLVKCAILHFATKESTWGGRFLRKAFWILSEELPKGDLNYIIDVGLNIFGMFIRHGSVDVGNLMLRHCSALLSQYPAKELQRSFFDALSQGAGQSGPQSGHILQRLLEVYAIELQLIRVGPDRTSNQAQRRHHHITRDGIMTAAGEEVDDVIGRHERLLQVAISELGSEHDQTLRIGNEALRIQNYLGVYEKDYVGRITSSLFRLRQLYTTQQGCEQLWQWHISHQNAFLRFLERKFDYYKFLGKDEGAMSTGHEIIDCGGYRTERWVQFALQFESWLGQRGFDGVRETHRSKRLSSTYYNDLGLEYGIGEQKHKAMI